MGSFVLTRGCKIAFFVCLFLFFVFFFFFKEDETAIIWINIQTILHFFFVSIFLCFV